jgi:UDP-glucose:(heptosyl)LPS alpha-1,3-glucosyltransferase
MSATGVAVVFPEASRRGGVERVSWDVLAYFGPRRETTFVGASAPAGLPTGVRMIAAGGGGRLPAALEPLRFRRETTRRTRELDDTRIVSMGVAGPPTDVVWVHSVHRAWLRLGRPVPVGHLSVPARARYLMPRHLALLALERQCFALAHPRTLICTSPREVADLVDLYGVDPASTSVVPNSFDPALFNVDRRHELRSTVRERLGVANEEIAVFFVANELHRKGFAQLLRATSMLDDSRLSIHVLGRTSLGSYRPLIQELRLGDRVHHHGPTEDVGWWYAGADLLVLPTQYEPFGLVIIEALAAGVPVVTTRVAGAAEAVRPGETGLLQEDPYDVAELAQLIEWAVQSDLARWSAAAAASVAAYTRDVVMARVDALLFPR